MRHRLPIAAAAAVIGAAGGLVMGLLGVVIGLSSRNENTTVLLRGVLPLALLLLGTHSAAALLLRAGRPGPMPELLGGALTGYLLDPFSWDSRAGVAQLAVGAGATAYLLDLVVWLAAATLGVVWAIAGTTVPHRPATPYG